MGTTDTYLGVNFSSRNYNKNTLNLFKTTVLYDFRKNEELVLSTGTIDV